MDPAIIHRLILDAAEAVDQLPVQQPRPACVIDDGQHEVVMVHVVFDLALAREPVTNQLPSHRLIQRVPFHDRLGRTHIPPPNLE